MFQACCDSLGLLNRVTSQHLSFTDRKPNMSLHHNATKAEVIARMVQGTDDVIAADAHIIRTDNGYWVAWHEHTAAVIHEDAAADEACFWVEGVATLDELLNMLTNGDFDEIEDFDGDDAEWDDVVLDSDAHKDHEHGHDCDDPHCDHHH